MTPLFLILASWLTPAPTTLTTAPTPLTTTVRPEAPAPTCAAPDPPPAPPPKKTRALRVALTDVRGAGLSPQLSNVVTESLLEELRKLERVSVIGMGEIRALLDVEATKQLAGCTEESCLAGIADALGADAVVSVDVAVLEGQTVVALKRIDQRNGEVAHAFQRRLESAGGEELLAVVGPAVEELFPDVNLRAGTRRGVSPELALRLNPPPLEPWVFYSLAGVSGAALVASAAFYAASFGFAGALQDELKNDVSSGPVVTAAQDAGEGTQTAAVVAVAVGAVVGGGAAASFFFTDFDGDRVE